MSIETPVRNSGDLNLHDLTPVLDTALDAVVLMQSDGTVAAWNYVAEEVFGWSQKEAVGRSMADLIVPPDYRARHNAGLKRFNDTGRATILNRVIEITAQHKDGRTFPVELSITATQVGGRRMFIGFLRDITQRRNAQEALADSERRFRLLVQGVKDHAIYMLDQRGRITSWNAGAQRITGYTAEEVLGRNFAIFHTSEDQKAGRPDRALKIAEAAGQYEEEGGRLRKDGTRMLAHVVIEPVRDDSGELIGFAKVTRDITHKKNIERQLIQAQKMEAVGQLTGGIAHDFNNILSVVIGNLDMIVEELDENTDQKTLATEALGAAEKGAELVRHLLAFSRNQVLQVETLDVRAVISDAEPLLRRSLGGSVAIEFNCEEVWPVLADRSELENAIINLSINARDAMPNGGRLVIRCSNVSVDERLAKDEDLPMADYVVLNVADEGEGMDPEVLVRVFDPFFTTKEWGKGSGLGLSMVHGFARQSGGGIKIYSEPGRGTEVRLYLPRAYSEGEAESAETESVVPAPERQRILIVEDRDDVRKSAIRTAKSLGYDVAEADSAEAALELVDDGAQFDILFTDVVMPGGIDGVELAWRLRKRRPELRIILTSGFSDPEVIATDLGALKATLLPKPYRKADLSQLLRRALEQ